MKNHSNAWFNSPGCSRIFIRTRNRTMFHGVLRGFWIHQSNMQTYNKFTRKTYLVAIFRSSCFPSSKWAGWVPVKRWPCLRKWWSRLPPRCTDQTGEWSGECPWVGIRCSCPVSAQSVAGLRPTGQPRPALGREPAYPQIGTWNLRKEARLKYSSIEVFSRRFEQSWRTNCANCSGAKILIGVPINFRTRNVKKTVSRKEFVIPPLHILKIFPSIHIPKIFALKIFSYKYI